MYLQQSIVEAISRPSRKKYVFHKTELPETSKTMECTNKMNAVKQRYKRKEARSLYYYKT